MLHIQSYLHVRWLSNLRFRTYDGERETADVCMNVTLAPFNVLYHYTNEKLVERA